MKENPIRRIIELLKLIIINEEHIKEFFTLTTNKSVSFSGI